MCEFFCLEYVCALRRRTVQIEPTSQNVCELFLFKYVNCFCSSMFVRVTFCEYVCINIYINMYIYIYTYSYRNKPTNTHSPVYIQHKYSKIFSTCQAAYICVYMPLSRRWRSLFWPHVHTQSCNQMHTHKHTCHSKISVCVYIHTHIVHTPMCIHTHTYCAYRFLEGNSLDQERILQSHRRMSENMHMYTLTRVAKTQE